MTREPLSPDSPTIQRIFERCEHDPEGCWLWTGGTSRGGGKQTQQNLGYPSVWVVERKRTERGHVVIGEAFHGPAPEGHEWSHKCGKSLCCKPDDIEAQPPEENRQERIDRHRRLRGLLT